MEKEREKVGPLVIAVGIVKEGDKFLLDKRKSTIKEWNKWEIPGGKLEFGERIEEAVKRELKEELGIEVELVKQLPSFFQNVWKLKDREIHVVLVGYLCKLKNGEPRPLDKSVSDVAWFTFKEIKELARKNECLPGTLELISAVANE